MYADVDQVASQRRSSAVCQALTTTDKVIHYLTVASSNCAATQQRRFEVIVERIKRIKLC